MASKRVLGTMGSAILRTLGSTQWGATLDPEERTWILLLALCDSLHPFGSVTIPSRDQAQREAIRAERDAAIRREFNGRNYEELSMRYRLTTRQIRRITGRRVAPPDADA